MAATIVRGATGAPGVVAYPSGLTSGIFNELNFVIPEYIPKIVSKYGNNSYMLASEILGNSVVREDMVTTNTFSHFEKGRSFGVGIVSAAISSITSGSSVIVVLKSPESYNNGATGTQSPFNVGQTVKIRSNGRKASVDLVNRTTAGAFAVTLTPLGAYSIASGTSTSVLQALEGIELLGGTQLAGESSLGQLTTNPKLYRYDNTCTTLRVGCKSSDFASMNKTQIDFGGSNYIDKLAIENMNIQMLVSIEDAVLEGVPFANTTKIGTIGVLPEIVARGSEVDYTIGTFGSADFQRVTRVIDYNGGPAEYHFLQDINQRQNINTTLFGLYPNGMIDYGSVGFGAEAAVAYGFKSFSTDTVSFHFHRYKGFSASSVFGYTPTVGDYRANFGVAIPQGMLRDTKTGESMPYMQWVYQKNPDIPTSQKIYSWDMGFTSNTKTEEASNNYHQIAYVGSRVVAAEQFVLIQGT